MSGIEDDLLTCDKILKLANDILASYKVELNQIKLQDSLNLLRIDLDDQIKRARKKNFEIAVVGREKAGKSSLLNAWIGFELLPSERNRCTYTTTEIRSCANDDDQKYMIEYFTADEFKQSTTVSAEKGAESSSYLNDLREKEADEIKKYYDEISQHLNKPVEIEKFTDFEQVKKELNSAISYPGHARAVKRLCIWTSRLSSKENIVLYDVPGYDSPITLHKELTKAKIASVDAILYAKQFCSPDLVDCELEILKISDLNNPFIKAKDKIIVALTNCDLANSSREFSELINSNRKAWRVNGIAESRLVPVCSLAELKQNSAEAIKVHMSLQNLNGGDTGFIVLKEAVNQCVQDSKYMVASDRCDDIKNKSKDFINKLFDCVKADYNMDIHTEMRSTLGDDEMEKIYNEWWAKQWKHIEEDFQSFYHTKIRPKIGPDSPAYLSKEDIGFKELYERTVEKTFQEIPATTRQRQEAIYVSCIGNDGIIDPKEGNTKIRLELSRDSINSLDKITCELNTFLWTNIDKMIAWIRKTLWNLPEIRKEMIGVDEGVEIKLMNRSFDSLIQRLARPATDIFLRFPRSKIQRIRVMQEFQMELLILNKYMVGGKICERGIIQFLANGKLGHFEIEIQQSDIVLDVPSENDERKDLQIEHELVSEIAQREELNKSKRINKTTKQVWVIHISNTN